ncbi:MAG: prepilin-type N-terminal cleavage/methylation domain-containing protein [Planctomycetes bacterium]|nr:prepilin-type N-terminal cleavage/methylation domain-containing protein [Planctomycetota bacterium]
MQTLVSRRASSLGRAGFTLIEILAVILIIGILMTFLLPRIPEAIDAAKITACKKNLQELHNGLTQYKIKFNRVPEKSGVKFFACLISRKVWENTKFTADKLRCPAVDLSGLEIGQIEDPLQWYASLDSVNGGYSSYAGRDIEHFPLRDYPGSGKEPVIADDNEGDGTQGNHRSTTVVLYASGDVGTFEIAEQQEKGVIDQETNFIKVGPDSPIEELRKLSLD